MNPEEVQALFPSWSDKDRIMRAVLSQPKGTRFFATDIVGMCNKRTIARMTVVGQLKVWNGIYVKMLDDSHRNHGSLWEVIA